MIYRGVCVTVNDSNIHHVADCHVERINDNTALATGMVSGKFVSLTYTGEIDNSLGKRGAAKPWLNQVRKDLVTKYISMYGDKEEEEGIIITVEMAKNKEINKYHLMVDSDFLATLRAAKFNVSDNGDVSFITGDSCNITNMLQIDAIKAIAKTKAKADKKLSEEREIIERMLSQLTA